MMADFRFPQGSPPQALQGLLLTAIVGGLMGGAAYVSFAWWFEILWMSELAPLGTPTLSYGQQWGVLAVVAAGVGAATGLGATLVLRSKWILGNCLGVGYCVLAGLGAVSLWADQRTRYGYDPSEWVLYPPLLAIVATAVVTFALVTGVAAALRLLARQRPS